MNGLIIRPGIQADAVQRGVTPRTELRILRSRCAQIRRARISFGYERSKLWSVRGDFHSTTNGASYTAITPHTQQSARFVVRYHPLEKLSVENEVTIANNKLITTNYQNNIRSNAITVSYSLGEKLSVFGGFSYDSYYAQGNILYARGTAPLTDVLLDQEINRCGPAELRQSRPNARDFG